MSLPANGITHEVIRDMMPPYHLSADLMAGTFAALPPPPPDAPQDWRHARITRLTQEIGACKPADAGQARIAADLLIVRGLAATIAARAYAPELTIQQMCRVARSAGELLRTADMLERTLARQQQKPVPFFGTVVQDEVDLAAVDAAWCGQTPAAEAGDVQGGAPGACPYGAAVPDEAVPDEAGPDEAGPAAWDAAGPPAPGENPQDAPQAADPAGSATAIPASQPADSAAPVGLVRLVRSPDAATRPGPDAGASPEWIVTKLDEGPGWTTEVVRRRSSAAVGESAAPGAGARCRGRPRGQAPGGSGVPNLHVALAAAGASGGRGARRG